MVLLNHQLQWKMVEIGLVWFGYAAGTTVTHRAPTGDSHPHPITKDNTTTPLNTG